MQIARADYLQRIRVFSSTLLRQKYANMKRDNILY